MFSKEVLKFRIVTVCNSLILTNNRKEVNPRTARRTLVLHFDYVIEHRKGERMQYVDALSCSTNI